MSRPATALLVLVLCGCDRGPATAPPAGGPSPAAPATPKEVRLVMAATRAWPRSLRLTGTLAPHETVTVAAKVAGRVERVHVDLGTPVEAGAPLVELDAVDLRLAVRLAVAARAEARARLGLPTGDDAPEPGPAAPTSPAGESANVALARALLAEARAAHERAVILGERGVSTPADLDAAVAALRAGEARLAAAEDEDRARRALLAQREVELAIARQRLDDAIIRAPFTGATLARLVGPGDYVGVGAAVASVVRLDPLRLRVDVPELESAQVKLGQRARVTVDGQPGEHEGVVARLSPALRLPARVLDVELEVTGPARAGGFCRVVLVVDPDAQALAVPRSAVRSFAGVDKVVVVDGGKAAERRVTLGRRDEQWVEVVGGLEAGARVIDAPASLRSGDPVTVAAGG